MVAVIPFYCLRSTWQQFPMPDLGNVKTEVLVIIPHFLSWRASGPTNYEHETSLFFRARKEFRGRNIAFVACGDCLCCVWKQSKIFSVLFGGFQRQQEVDKMSSTIQGLSLRSQVCVTNPPKTFFCGPHVPIPGAQQRWIAIVHFPMNLHHGHYSKPSAVLLNYCGTDSESPNSPILMNFQLAFPPIMWAWAPKATYIKSENIQVFQANRTACLLNCFCVFPNNLVLTCVGWYIMPPNLDYEELVHIQPVFSAPPVKFCLYCADL